MKRFVFIVLCCFCLCGCQKQTNEMKDEARYNPTLELIGDKTITLEENEQYNELGVVAKDAVDGDLTSKVEIDGTVKKEPGEYTITYKVKNSGDLETVITRTVIVKASEVMENAPFVPVLMYHYFYDDEHGETGKDGNYLAKSDFEAQLKYLKENGYTFPTMKELREYVDGKRKLPKKSILLTMDDGAESNYRIAYPLAVKYQIPIIWFVVTSWTDPSLPYQQEIINSGYVSMESHTHDMHRGGCSGIGHGGLFQCISKEEGVKDLKTSYTMLKTASSVAYPFGDYNDQTKEMVKEAGYSLAFTTEWGVVRPGMDPYALPRVRISAGNSLQTFISSIA